MPIGSIEENIKEILKLAEEEESKNAPDERNEEEKLNQN